MPSDASGQPAWARRRAAAALRALPAAALRRAVPAAALRRAVPSAALPRAVPAAALRRAVPAAALPRAIAVAALLALAACNTDFAPQYRVTDLRVLALRATVEDTWADALPGDVLVLEALVANPDGLAPLTVTWYGCLPRADELLPPCLDPELLRQPERLAAEAADPASGVLRLGEGERISVPVPAAEVAAALAFIVELARSDPAFRCRLYAELPVVAVLEAEGRRQLAVKRVRVAPRPEDLAGAPELVDAYVRNANPGVRDVLWAPPASGSCGGGGTLTSGSIPAGDAVLCGVPAPGSAQAYDLCGPDGPEVTSEALEWQWYVTAGEFPEFEGIGNATGTSVEFVPPAVRPFTLWTILRDGRGGTTWREWGPLELAPP